MKKERVYDGWILFAVHKCSVGERVGLLVRPKPKWCPARLYWWLVTKILYLKIFKEGEE